MGAVDPEIMGVFLEELEEALAGLRRDASLPRIRKRIAQLAASSRLVGEMALASDAQAALAAIEPAADIDACVVTAVRTFTSQVVAHARAIAAKTGGGFSGDVVELAVGAPRRSWRTWWR
jgi:hypothetical protein